MSSISLEAFDGNLRGKLSQWILPSQDFCALPNGFQDQILSTTPPFQTHILLMSKQDSKAWLLCYSWDMTFIPETPNDWSLLLSVIQHLKKPILIVTTPKTHAPPAFWQKCQTIQVNPPTCVCLRDMPPEDSNTITIQQNNIIPNTIFYPKLDIITESQFTKLSSILPASAQQSIQLLDLRSVYRDLRGAGASLCLSLTDSRFSTSGTSTQPGGSIPSFNCMWFYPEINGALRLHISDLRMILRTVTERLAGP
jgi:hypothetical protein